MKMDAKTDLESERVLLRQWVKSDISSFIALNSDPHVTRYFPRTFSEQESKGFVAVMSSMIDEHGWGFWAAELKSSKEFIGFVGLNSPRPIMPFSPCIEVGWRLLKQHWGNGYATEAGKLSLAYAFDHLEVNEVVSFTTESNFKSRKVMERLGMENTGNNFKYPDLPIEHPLSEHVLYKISRAQWSASGF